MPKQSRVDIRRQVEMLTLSLWSVGSILSRAVMKCL